MSIERVQSDIQRAISNIIEHEVQNPKIGFVTITGVKLQPDYSTCTVYYMLLSNSNEDRVEVSKEALESSKSFIRGKLGHKVQMRKVPELIFEYDTALDQGNRIDSLLGSINNSTEASTPVVETPKTEVKVESAPVAAKTEVKAETKPAETTDENGNVVELPSNLEKLTVAELKTLCKSKGIKGYSKLKKAELVALLK